MKGLRLLVSLLVGFAAGAGTVFGLTSLDMADEQGLIGGFYSALVIYPAGLLIFAFAFWIVYAAMDPGSEQ